MHTGMPICGILCGTAGACRPETFYAIVYICMQTASVECNVAILCSKVLRPPQYMQVLACVPLSLALPERPGLWHLLSVNHQLPCQFEFKSASTKTQRV